MVEFTKKEQTKAIDQVVKIINKYKLNIIVDHQIKIVPFLLLYYMP